MTPIDQTGEIDHETDGDHGIGMWSKIIDGEVEKGTRVTGERILVIEQEDDVMTLRTQGGRTEGMMTPGTRYQANRGTQVRLRCVACLLETTSLNLHINCLQTSKAATGQTDEEKKAERLAKLEAWKQKQAAERERKQKELEASGGTRSLLDEIDKKATITSAAASPRSPATVDGDASPAPYAGKFDPKAIVKKATSGPSTMTKLGTDIALPEIAKASATLNSTNAGLKANKSPATAIAASGKC